LPILPTIIERLRGAADLLEARSISAASARSVSDNPVLDEYVVGTPCAQNAVDALPGWNLALPPQAGVAAGHGAFYNDPRILWALKQFGSIEGRKILELGPLEASHTWLLEQHGPSEIHAIEANKLSYLRCLVVKELVELKTAKFYLGDFNKWLENVEQRYDLVVASGVLYHMDDPIGLLERIAKRTDAFYLWTHYMSDEAMPDGDPRPTRRARAPLQAVVLRRVAEQVVLRRHSRSASLGRKERHRRCDQGAGLRRRAAGP